MALTVVKITDVKTVLLTGPSGNDPFLQSIRKSRSAAFIEIHTDTDIVGIGETYLGYHAPEIVPEIVDFFKPILVGLDEKDINPRRLWERMYRCANFWARAGAGTIVLAGIEGALWDLRGKMDGVPVYKLLGGRMHDKLPCYATGCASDYPWTELLRKVDLYREAGFNAMKVGSGWNNSFTGESFNEHTPQAWVEMESEKLETVRKHTGKDFIICLDGHMSNVDEGKISWDIGIARAVLTALEPYDIFFFEEPLAYNVNNISCYAQLCDSTSIPVAGGEGLTSREEFSLYAQGRAFDVAQPDASYIGIWTFLEVAQMFAVQGKQVATHAWSSGGGVMENIHAAFATPNIKILEIPPLAGELHTEVYSDGYCFEEGYILPPESPGLGIRLTDSLKNKFCFVRGSGEWNAVPGKSEYM